LARFEYRSHATGANQFQDFQLRKADASLQRRGSARFPSGQAGLVGVVAAESTHLRPEPCGTSGSEQLRVNLMELRRSSAKAHGGGHAAQLKS
jgi:hypothetical protein